MNKNIVIIHYNTPLLTECLVRSINLFVKDAKIYIFDNSNKYPFTASFENVTLLNNTKGEIVDFNKWLDNYKNKSKSNGKVNGWGSAKHCYSVEKCMEIIKDNFILLDSDVLLKKDISELFDDNIVYAGEVIVQPSSTIKRILPFITYINTKMCLEKGIHYFDDNYMHGLYKSATADRFDTGAGFYINASKYPHKSINYGEYVIHYGHGSWNKKGCKPICNPSEWLSIHKSLWSTEKNKRVVYTCITGGYDAIIDPKVITKGFDYICFTDNMKMESNIWEIRPLPKETEGLSQVKKQRYVKINPHLHLSEYDVSIWVDGNVTIKSNLNEFTDKFLRNDCSIYVPKHPSRDCIYNEANIVVAMKKDSNSNITPQIERYKKEGFPKNYGLLQSNIMLRKHNNEDCIRFMEQWFEEVKNGSHRDQLSFNYVAWKNEDIKIFYLDKTIYKSQWFNWGASHKKSSRSSSSLGIVQPLKRSKKTTAQLREEFKALMDNRRRIPTYRINIY